MVMPSKQFGKLAFAKDRMAIICETGRAFINIKEQKSAGPDIVLKDYDTLPSSINLFYPFWLNISNCKPKVWSKKLQIQFSVMFIQTESDLTTILIAACSAIAAVIFIIGVAVYCVRKKDTSGLASPEANVDVYQPFQGPMGEPPPVPPLNRINKDKGNEDPLASSKRLEFYSFNKSGLNEPIGHEDTSLDMVNGQKNGPVPMA
ncbi:CUB domain-containing protein 1-like [Xenopus laevis]|uniref:CUB domain-containing protein 1-like n=1 Tax=Xenopus laevis TaxID=8355 RepID=A0A8J1ME86_XENLA|nr:CUB domain-containing protein 1-like [Xenopus laevis]